MAIIILSVIYLIEKHSLLEKKSDFEEICSTETYCCCACISVPVKPVMAFCGHVFCWKCYNLQYKKSSNKFCCPCCFTVNKTNIFVPIFLPEKDGPRDEQEIEERPNCNVFDVLEIKVLHRRAELFDMLVGNDALVIGLVKPPVQGYSMFRFITWSIIIVVIISVFSYIGSTWSRVGRTEML